MSGKKQNKTKTGVYDSLNDLICKGYWQEFVLNLSLNWGFNACIPKDINDKSGMLYGAGAERSISVRHAQR